MNNSDWLGKISVYLLYRTRLKYLEKKNTSSVHNNGGIVSGNCTLAYPEHIYLGKNSYINGGQIIASPHTKSQSVKTALYHMQFTFEQICITLLKKINS